MIAYEHMEAQLRRDLVKPTPTTTWQTLVDSVRDSKDLWKDIYRTFNSQLQNTDSTTTTVPRNYPNSTYQSKGQYHKGFSTRESRTQKFGYPSNNFMNNRPSTSSLYTEGKNNSYYSQQPQHLTANRPYQPNQNYQQNQRAFSNSRPSNPNRQPLRITDGRYAGSSQPPRFDNSQRRIKAYNAFVESDPNAPNESTDALANDMQENEEVENFPVTEDTYQDEYHQGVEDNHVLAEDPNQELSNDPAIYWVSTPTARTCTNCQAEFASNNKLHRHLKEKACRKRVEFKLPIPTPPELVSLIKPTALKTIAPGYAFRGYRYATVSASFSPEGKQHAICVDTGCTMSLVDRKFLNENVPDAQIHQSVEPIQVTGIGSTKHQACSWATILIHLHGMHGKYAVMEKEFHLVDNLKANMLIGVDIIAPGKFNIDLGKAVITLLFCDNTQVPLIVTSSNKVSTSILSKDQVTIQPKSRQLIMFTGKKSKLTLPTGRDFLFELKRQSKLIMYTHIVDCNMTQVIVQNDGTKPIVLPKNTKLEEVHDPDIVEAYRLEFTDD